MARPQDLFRSKLQISSGKAPTQLPVQWTTRRMMCKHRSNCSVRLQWSPRRLTPAGRSAGQRAVITSSGRRWLRSGPGYTPADTRPGCIFIHHRLRRELTILPRTGSSTAGTARTLATPRESAVHRELRQPRTRADGEARHGEQPEPLRARANTRRYGRFGRAIARRPGQVRKIVLRLSGVCRRDGQGCSLSSRCRLGRGQRP